MAELDSWAVGATADRKVGTEDARRAISALLWPGSTPVGITAPGLRLAAGNPGKVLATGSPGPTVTVNALQAFPDLAARPGAYIATLDATKTVDVLGANPADPSNQRNDLIIAQQNDADYGDADRLFTVKRVTGTPSGSPVDPTVTGSPNYLLLARIRVAALATTITNAMIDDLRPPFLVALGGIKPVATKTARDALPLIDGLVIYRQDRDWLEACDGTAWRVQGVAICTSTSDRDTAVTDPYNGLLAFTTDTASLWRYTGSAYARYPQDSQSDTQNTAGTTSSASYTATLGGGGTACGLAFTAPPSGTALIINNCGIDHTVGSATSWCSVRVRTGGAVGSGSDVLAINDSNSIHGDGTGPVRGSATVRVSGLTPGSTYNVQQLFKTDGGATATFADKHLIVMPS